MHWILKVRYINDYKLEIEFNDGKVKIVDFSEIVGGTGIFEPFKNIEYFKNVTIDSCGNSICWENGADICPDVLYDISKK